MTEYLVLLTADEAAYQQATPEERAAVHAQHTAFAAALAERGHTMTGGAQLAGSQDARVVRGGPDGHSVTQGPYAETVEQMGGFYLVETSDLDDLLDLAGLLADPGTVVEVRACLPGPGGDA